MLTGEGPHHGEILREATRLVEAGKIVPGVDPHNFTLDKICDAYQKLKTREAAGKLVVEIT